MPIAGGVYIIHIDVPGVGQAVRWFGVMRQLIWTISKTEPTVHKSQVTVIHRTAVRKVLEGVHVPNSAPRSNTIVTKTPNARQIKKFAEAPAPRPLISSCWPTRQFCPTEGDAPIAMSNAPKGDSNTPTPSNSVIRA